MLKNINFRYRGPLESEKHATMEKDTIQTINELINSTTELMNQTKIISTNIMTNIKRRGEYDGNS